MRPIVTLSSAEFQELRDERVAIPVDDALFRIEGSGAADCLQGLLTNDVARLADHTAVWGAFLTPKGMIITDAWVARTGDSMLVAVPAGARDTVAALFARTMPPRIARVTDVTDSTRMRWLCGGAPASDEEWQIVRPREAAPFTALALAATTAASVAPDGWKAVPAAAAHVLRLLGGWPALGREIDEKTLPQEVRFDELGGVKYDKGCYTGQETVARLHFRGHANRILVGVCWAPGERPTAETVSDGARDVGTLRTLIQIDDTSVALAVVRRDVSVGDTVRTGESEAVVVLPPIDLGGWSVA